MKILHTSDWHLGRTLFTKRRYDEFESFLNWLADLLDSQKIDVLLVSGDIFDTSTPSTRATELYFNFLARVSKSYCKHVVITAGNHDSPTLLNAPGAVLKPLNIHVVAFCSEPKKVVLHFTDVDNQESLIPDGVNVNITNTTNDTKNVSAKKNELIVCAVPFLHDRDVRRSSPGETQEEKQKKLLDGIREHYKSVCEEALRIQSDRYEMTPNKCIPIIVMGHLFAAGASTSESDGVRELYIGSLAQIGADIFPDYVDYVALGHLHSAQKIGAAEHIRYCGSPIPMGFGEAAHEKVLILVEYDENANTNASGNDGSPRKSMRVEHIPVPCFQKLAQIKGDWNRIASEIGCLVNENTSIWLEIEYNGNELMPNLKSQVEELIKETGIEVLRLVNKRALLEFQELSISANPTVSQNTTSCGSDDSASRLGALPENCLQSVMLDEISPHEIFERCLEIKQIPETQRNDLKNAFSEVFSNL
ncbi:MAG: exonuclease SbcCD subunit D C-terminal domain-containing protein [Thermoguttaceae bacterium]